MTTQIKLQEASEIKLGMAFKSAIKDVGALGNAFLIQTRDFSTTSEFSVINEKSLAQIEVEEKSYSIAPGDVLLRLRGPVFTARLFSEQLSKPALTTNQVAVIKVNRKILDPYFLVWHLNSSVCKRYFDALNEGTNIAKLSRKMISDMPLTLPTLENQRKIGAIQKNWLLQKSIYQKLVESGDAYFNGICHDIMSEKLR